MVSGCNLVIDRVSVSSSSRQYVFSSIFLIGPETPIRGELTASNPGPSVNSPRSRPILSISWLRPPLNRTSAISR
jgi:hypothetical protein